MGKIETATQWAINIANDPSHGYDQDNRWGPDYDCSSLVISAWQAAGVPVKTKGATYTGDMKNVFLSCGFSNVTSKVNLTTGSGLQRGDVLLNIQSHTVMYIGNNQIVSASKNENGGYHGGKPGDQTGKEIYIGTYYNFPWDCVLRYTADDGGGTTPSEPGNKYVRQGQTEANKFANAGIPITGSRDAATKKGGIKVLQPELHPKSWTRKSTKGVQKSMGKELFSEELKLAVVQYVLEGHTRKEASEKFCVSCTPIEKWVNLYKLHGAKGLLSRNLVGRQKGFDGEFRLKVLQYKQEHHLSCTQTAMHFCLDVVTVCRWEKKFQKEGAQGLMKKQATKGSEKRQKKQEKSELQQENKRLSEENYRLRMENDYLKKLNALIQKREKPE